MLAGYYAFSDDGRLPELSLALLEKGLGEDGWIELCMPTRFERTIPSFTFCWVLALALENGSKLKVDISAVGGASIEKLIIPSGTINIEVVGASHALRNWQPLVACGTAVIGEQVKALVSGDGNGEAVFESRNGILGVKFSRGTILCFR